MSASFFFFLRITRIGLFTTWKLKKKQFSTEIVHAVLNAIKHTQPKQNRYCLFVFLTQTTSKLTSLNLLQAKLSRLNIHSVLNEVSLVHKVQEYSNHFILYFGIILTHRHCWVTGQYLLTSMTKGQWEEWFSSNGTGILKHLVLSELFFPIKYQVRLAKHTLLAVHVAGAYFADCKHQHQ